MIVEVVDQRRVGSEAGPATGPGPMALPLARIFHGGAGGDRFPARWPVWGLIVPGGQDSVAAVGRVLPGPRAGGGVPGLEGQGLCCGVSRVGGGR